MSQILQTAITSGRPLYLTTDIGVGRRKMQVIARKVVCNEESQDKIVVAFEDITDRQADVATGAGTQPRYKVDQHALISSRPI